MKPARLAHRDGLEGETRGPDRCCARHATFTGLVVRERDPRVDCAAALSCARPMAWLRGHRMAVPKAFSWPDEASNPLANLVAPPPKFGASRMYSGSPPDGHVRRVVRAHRSLQ